MQCSLSGVRKESFQVVLGMKRTSASIYMVRIGPSKELVQGLVTALNRAYSVSLLH